MAQSQLYLIGTVHVDVKGPVRLKKLLNFLQPQNVVIEADLRGAKLSQQMLGLLSSTAGFDNAVEGYIKFYKGANPETVKRVLKIASFEYFVCKEYCESMSIPLYLADKLDWKWYRTQMANPESEISRDLAKHLRMTPTGLARRVTQYYNGKLGQISAALLTEYIQRENSIGLKARSLEGKVATITGLRHSHGTNSLYERLSDLSPTRLTLLDADKL